MRGQAPATPPAPIAEIRCADTIVVAQLDKLLGRRFAGPLVFLAGRHYRDPLAAYAGERARVPMAGLGIGQQKAWLAQRVREARERADRAAQLDLFNDLPPIADDPPIGA